MVDDIIKEISNKTLLMYIKESSFYQKHPEAAKVSEASGRRHLERVYRRCREYACESIVSGLKDFKELKSGEFYHLYCKRDKFRILARVRTNWEEETIEETAEQRAFLSFSVLTERNLSHFPGRVVYGFHTGVTPSMIGYIYPHDADTVAWAENRLELAELPEILLDLDDLCEAALAHKTYCQISIESKTAAKIPLAPDVVIAIDAPTFDDRLAASERNLPILVLHRSHDTLVNVYDFFATPELAKPRLI